MCANHSWKALGGDNGSVPAWGCANANEVYDKVKESGRYWTGTPKRGALVLWKYGNNGHAAICHTSDGSDIDTTNPDPDNSSGTATAVEDIGYPAKWGATDSARIWTDQYNNVRFPVGDEEDDVRHVFLYLSTTKDFNAGSFVAFDTESSDEAGFHNAAEAAIKAPWNCVGTWYVEVTGGGVIEFEKHDKDNELVGDIGRSAEGNFTMVGALNKGERYRVKVVEGAITSASLKADIRER